MEAGAENAIEEKVDEALFPGIDVGGAMLAAKISVKSEGGVWRQGGRILVLEGKSVNAEGGRGAEASATGNGEMNSPY
jgi:hypothetical protein